jgi:hypothetical protein
VLPLAGLPLISALVWLQERAAGRLFSASPAPSANRAGTNSGAQE